MVRLSRRVRFSLNPPGEAGAAHAEALEAGNGFGGTPAMRGLGRHYELDVTCSGEVDPRTGYLVNIKDIDDAVRTRVVPLINRACLESPWADPAELLPRMLGLLAGSLPGVRSLCWRLSPTYSVEMHMEQITHAVIRQQLDFAAAHRLHAPELSDQENVAQFGKCNNPSGHGHNYRVEPAVRVRLAHAGEGRTATRYGLAELERDATACIIDRFDHKHLNRDTREFASDGGLNPSVENIAKVCFELLSSRVRERSHGSADLVSVTVWETDRTSCTYPG